MDYDVVVIGAGVAGLTQTLALAQAGFKVAVVEQGACPKAWHHGDPWDNRVVALSRASQDYLATLGVWSELMERRIAPYNQMHLSYAGFPERTLKLTAAAVAEPDLGHVVEQHVLRDALLRQCESLDACAWFWGQSVQEFNLSDTVSSLRLSSGVELRAALIIAADGAKSPAKHLLGEAELSWSYQARAIVTTLQSTLPHRQTARQWFLSTGTLALLPLSDPQLCSLVWSVPPQNATDLERLSDSSFCRALARNTDQVLGDFKLLTPRLSFPLQSLINHHFASAGLAFIADAAHVVHPLAGQGLNLGLEDVRALTTILVKAKALGRPLGHMAILKPYARARRAAALQTATLMTFLEKAGRWSGRNADLCSRILNSASSLTSHLCGGSARLPLHLVTSFALHSLTK